MTFYALAAFINAVSSLAIGVSVMAQSRKGKSARIFIVFMLVISLWSFGYFIWQLSPNAQFALRWTRMLSVASYFLPVLYLHWVSVWLETIKQLSRRIIITAGYLIAGALSVATLFTDLVIPYVMQTPFFDYWPKGGPLYLVFPGVLYSGLVSVLLIDLVRTYRRVQGLKRYQIKYIMMGVLFTTLGGATNFPLWYNIPIPPIGNIFVTVGLLSLVYVVIRYRLMDMRSIAVQAIIFGVEALYVYGFFYGAIIVMTRLYDGVFTAGGQLTSVVLAPLFIVSLYALDKKLKILVRTRLFVQLYEYQDTITQLASNLSHYLDLNKIIDLIVTTTRQTMQLNRTGVLLVDTETQPYRYRIAKVIGFDENNGISLVQDNYLTQHLLKTQRILVLDELDIMLRQARQVEERQSISHLQEQMTKIEASLCVPLISRGNIIGILVLGSKTSGEAYTRDDLNLLTTLANQAGMAIENAQLYQKIQQFSSTLAERVDEQTKQIRLKNQWLEELIQIKDDFLRTANHQLNTPITIVRSALEMMDSGVLDSKEGLETVRIGFGRIASTVADFWRAFDLQGDIPKVSYQQVDIKAIVDGLLIEKKHLKEAIDRKLVIEAVTPDFPIPTVWCNREHLTYSLSNLLDNAVFYTQQGKITVTYNQLDNGQTLQVSITDTGYGILPEEKIRLFQKFIRGTDSVLLKPDGSGLGLYITKKFIEANNGTVSVFSAGRNQGSTFSITLPVYDQSKAQA